MALEPVVEQCFPLADVASIVRLFRQQLETPEPDLALLSIVVGAVENSLTCSRPASFDEVELPPSDTVRLPPLELHIAEALHTKFHAILKGSVDLTLYEKRFASRELIKKVSDVIWNSLTRRHYNERAHLQSIYSYLTGNKLDCFGVAFAVVAGCQALGFKDVHLALSEDHAWVTFGEPGKQQTAEVTWHGKGNEDKRGQLVVEDGSGWLYLKGNAVKCTRHMEVVALVSSINPSLNLTNDAIEVAILQQELLWLLYDMGHMKKYPMALGNLGDLEELFPTPGRASCASLFKEAITSARSYYKNHHVYPYTYQGGYYYRHNMYKEAFESWANAADVIQLYNYNRDDEEIYKEFLEIANELIPYAIKVESSGISAHSILKDPECFASLLRFYDGICRWEEGSATPVLHIGWAKPLVNAISKFDALVRAQVDISLAEEELGSDRSKYLNNNNEIEAQLSGLAAAQTATHPSIAALTEACSETLLNPSYLLRGVGNPFVDNASPLPTTPVPDEEQQRPSLRLHSRKMAGLKDVLLAEKLNTSAISLQLTAQSQVQIGGRKTRAAEPVAAVEQNDAPKAKKAKSRE
ncbi:Hypothetical predicted protein [Cloeon dipterum]|uniref:Menin n=1 Tax=Cloeon dipterum TaxID=197152 RepID=A0A8S1CJS4_9INSE|nr:Hypothetical predicted protein [Cloeon dipterum]